MLGHRFQQPNRERHLPGVRGAALGRTVDHIDLRFRLIGSTPKRLEQQIPGIRGIAEIAGTAVLTLLRQFGLLGEVLEFLIVGTDHQAHDLIGALLVEAVLVIEFDLVAGF